MRRHDRDSHDDEVELSRRSFFSRLALGTVLSITMPGVVHAASKKAAEAHKNARTAQANKSAVRLPKTSATTRTTKQERQVHKVSTSHGGGKAQKTVSAKHHSASPAEQGHLQTAAGKPHEQHASRVRDVYQQNKHGAKTAVHVAEHHDKGHSIIQPPRETFIPTQEPLILADRSRLNSHRSLAFQNPHTGDKLNLTYFERGHYLNDALDEISFLLRDYRTGDVHDIDPSLLDQLHDLKQMLGLNQPFHVISGYRSPLTNAKLHAEHAGVANNSFHMYGRAVDIRIERFDLRRIHNAAIAMHRGGVGYYPGSNFIHLDTGTFRTWSL